jgi:hypothetical protein
MRCQAAVLLFAVGCHHTPKGAVGAPPANTGVDASIPADAPVVDAATVADATHASDVAPPADTGNDMRATAADASLSADAPSQPTAATALVAGLSIDRFKDNIRMVASFGDREEGSPRFDAAATWLEGQLRAMGYTPERHAYTFRGAPRTNVFATKIGKSPDRMYIVSSHLDGRGGGGGADDNGSGVALVLEVARALSRPGVTTDVSVRFTFWCNEETGMDGSGAYVKDRAALQGVENPPGSGRYPEPRWLGMIQHDMMLYDHGLPPTPEQSPTADIDIDYQVSSKMANESKALAQTFQMGARSFAKDYPSKVGANMAGTDSVSFQDFSPSISVREAKRIEEIIRGSNPNHHKPSDVYESYSEKDFLLGFNALETTMGTVAQLAGARMGP